MSGSTAAITDPILDQVLTIDPEQPIESWRLQVPAKAACYLLSDEADQPIVLATVGDLRAALVRRMTENDQPSPSRRIDYRQVVRSVRYRRVGGPFEANWVYLENVRRLYPDRYGKLIRRFGCHWVRMDPHDDHPRFIVSKHATEPYPTCYGPFNDSRTPRRLIESLEILFDLCREHDILKKMPHGAACAYKEMGRCPAPCDGSISMEAYRGQLHQAVTFIAAPEAAMEAAETKMKSAADALDFERAAATKKWLGVAKSIPKIMPSIDRFAFVGLQPGSVPSRQTLFWVDAQTIERLGDFAIGDELWTAIRSLSGREQPPACSDSTSLERIGLVAYEQARPQGKGVWYHADRLNDVDALCNQIKSQWDQAPPEETTITTMSSDE
jgi:hypothetical protein